MGEKRTQALNTGSDKLLLLSPEIPEDWVQLQSSLLFSKLQGILDLNHYGEVLLEHVATCTGANAGVFYTQQVPDGLSSPPAIEKLQLATSFGIEEKNLKKQISKNDPLTGKTFLTKQSHFYENVPISDSSDHTRLGSLSLYNISIIPIMHNSTIIGIIEIYGNTPLTNLQRQFLQFISLNLGQGVKGILNQLYNQKILQELAESHSQLESQKKALDSAAIVAETDPRGRITYVNEKFLALSKYSAEELIGFDHRIINSRHHPKEFFHNLWRTISSGEVWHGEIKNRAKDGTYYWVDTTIYPLKNTEGQIIKYIAIRFEITDKKQAFENLQIANEATQKAADAKTAFLSNMSHEIRTPLNSIIGLTDVLKETELSEDQKKYVGTIEYASKSLLNIVNDILDLSKLNAGQVKCDKRSFSLRSLIQDTIAMISSQIHAKNIEIITNIESTLSQHYLGDEFRINQVLMNLLGNAVKFTTEGSIELSVTTNKDPSRNGNILFRIKDTGAGIPEEAQKSLFQAFHQGDNSITKKFGGTGLGLFISKKLVDLMGGEIWFESTTNEGSTFYFTLNLVQTLHAPSHRTEEPPAPLKISPTALMQKIMVVDDCKENRDLIKLYLKDQNCEVIEAENGVDAIEKFKKQTFNLVLMDVQMPLMDGFECTKMMRNIEAERKLKHTPIVALTACVLNEELQKTRESGCDDHTAKPISKKTLLALMKKSSWF